MFYNIKAKLVAGDQRSSKAKRNILSTFAIKGGSTLVNLLLVPTYISFLNVTNYGIWITLSTIIAWFSFFDIGFGHGLRNKFAEAVANDDHKLAKTYVSTTYAIVSLIVVSLWLLFFLINHWIDWSKILNVTASQKVELSEVALIVFSSFCLLFVLKLISSILSGNQQPAKASFADFSANAIVLMVLLLFKLVPVNGSLTLLAVTTGSVQVGVLLILSVGLFTTDLKRYAPSFKYIDFSQIRLLMGLGIKFFIIQIGAVLIFEVTNIIITQLVGPSSVAVYNTTYKYFAMATMITGIVAAPLWSAFTDAYVKKDYGWMQKVVRQLDQFAWLMLGLILAMLALSHIFFHYWIGDSMAISWTTSILMAINIALTIRWNLMILVINGTGKLKFQLIANVTLSFVFIPMAYLLGKQFSLNGIIAANTIINMIYAIVVPIQSKKIVNRTAAGIWDS